MISVIITKNTRPASGCSPLTYYSAGGVFLALAQKGLDVLWADLRRGPEPRDNKPDTCCYAVFFGNKTSAFEHMKQARASKNPPRRIIAFGPFAAAFPEEVLTRGLADIVVAADPEFVIPLIISAGDDIAAFSAIPNVSYLEQGKVIATARQSFHDLDAIPFVGPYLYGLGDRPAYMITARGCQYHCVFCERNAIWGGGVRDRSVENVLREIEELVAEHHVSEILFLDEDIAADRKRLTKLCEGIRRIKGEFHWECSACVDSVSKELLLLMGYSRCSSVNFGVESASSKVLRQIGKKYDREDILNAVHWAKEAKLNVEIMITIGSPEETDEDRKLTLAAIKEMGQEISIVTTNRVLILPGTALYRRALKEGRFTAKEFFEHEGLIYYDEKEGYETLVNESKSE